MARILIVDDEANIRSMIRMALLQQGHEVDQAGDGPDGLTRFGYGKECDLVLLDQRMPGMDGLEVLREVRRRDPRAKVIMITAFGTVDLAVDAMKSGATDFLRKPFTLDMLRDAVKAALGPSLDAAPPPESSPEGTVYSLATLNGFRIESYRSPGRKAGVDTLYDFNVRNAGGESYPCTVVLPGYVVEDVEHHLRGRKAPGGERFWQGLCEEALATHLWQSACVPRDGIVTVEEYSSGLRKWVEAVLAAQP